LCGIPGKITHSKEDGLVNARYTGLKNDASPAEDRNTVANRIRAVLGAHGRLGVEAANLSAGDDLYAAGMTSLASVNVMLALEAEFDIEFPDNMLNRSVFSSVAAIQAAVLKITSG
jgi:acyl carrier protein